MSRLAGYLLSLGGFAILATLGVVWLRARPHARGPRRWLAAVVLFYLAASMRVVPWIVSRPLVYGFHHFSRSDVTADMTTLVVLGSGSSTVHGAEERVGVLDLAGGARGTGAADAHPLLRPC